LGLFVCWSVSVWMFLVVFAGVAVAGWLTTNNNQPRWWGIWCWTCVCGSHTTEQGCRESHDAGVDSQSQTFQSQINPSFTSKKGSIFFQESVLDMDLPGVLDFLSCHVHIAEELVSTYIPLLLHS
jgi:hypothetical protein